MTFQIEQLHQKTKREILEVWEVALEHMDSQDRKILALQTQIEQLEKERDELKKQVYLLQHSINGKLYDFTPRHTVIQELLNLANPLYYPNALAQHDKDVRKEFLSFIKAETGMTGIDKLVVHGLWVKFEQLKEK